ncbi:hypothetical protein [Paraburkholderia mimosarum]|uniref:hypothetical protein n=1 Tax=Paraburkholderia mimosarum TaxID=312026 RepID=UPI001EE17BF8|nr:hypothetical protein [Paraburkholderia mimosarum]
MTPDYFREEARAAPRAFDPMPQRFELVALALPADCPPESVPPAVGRLISAAWPGMSRAQLADRARRLDMRASLRVQPGFGPVGPIGPIGPNGLTQFRLALTFADGRFELVAHVRRVKRRRAGARRQKPSLPPARDIRQQTLF